jgi:hypothetical protein
MKGKYEYLQHPGVKIGRKRPVYRSRWKENYIKLDFRETGEDLAQSSDQ